MREIRTGPKSQAGSRCATRPCKTQAGGHFRTYGSISGTQIASIVGRSELAERVEPLPNRVGEATHAGTATWRSGYAAVCKTVYPGSIPGVASNPSVRLAFRQLGL